MNEVLLVQQVAKELVVDSRLLSGPLDVRHRNILDLIRTYSKRFERFGPVNMHSEEVDTPAGRRTAVFALLNEDQCYMLLTLIRNTEKGVDLKANLVAAFKQARGNSTRHELARAEGKVVRRLETDYISQLVSYAEADGSLNAKNYYSLITKVTLKALGLEPGDRDSLDAGTLANVMIAESLTCSAIRDGMAANMSYKDIYKLVKQRVTHVAALMQSTKLLT